MEVSSIRIFGVAIDAAAATAAATMDGGTGDGDSCIRSRAMSDARDVDNVQVPPLVSVSSVVDKSTDDGDV